MSNGAIMCYLLASELSDRIAAVAPVAGPMGTENASPKRPVPVIHFHGTDDQFAPFNGGKGSKSLSQTEFFSVEHSIRAWVKANGCPEEPVVAEEPNGADDGMTVQRKTYGPGNGRGGGRTGGDQRGWSHLARARTGSSVTRQVHQGHLRQRPDVGVFPEASDEDRAGLPMESTLAPDETQPPAKPDRITRWLLIAIGSLQRPPGQLPEPRHPQLGQGEGPGHLPHG